MHDFLSDKQVAELPPLIFGTIRWKSSVGVPTGDLCSGFNILVEERPVSRFQSLPGGLYEQIRFKWEVVKDSIVCRTLSTEGDNRAIGFHVTGLHLNGFPDGAYRITPSFRGNWHFAGLLAPLGYRVIEPIRWYVVLKKDDHIQSVEFEVVRRSWFSGRRLG